MSFDCSNGCDHCGKISLPYMQAVSGKIYCLFCGKHQYRDGMGQLVHKECRDEKCKCQKDLRFKVFVRVIDVIPMKTRRRGYYK